MGPLEVAAPMSYCDRALRCYGATVLRCYGATVLRCYGAASAKSQMGRCRFGPKLHGLWLVLISRLCGSVDPETLSSDVVAKNAQRLRPESGMKAMVAAAAASSRRISGWLKVSIEFACRSCMRDNDPQFNAANQLPVCTSSGRNRGISN